ncbi:hypothetical protein GQ607_006847 [Colletotrichum asianum]|uniref:Uncharacterized protein n=1 Tax=Colletotrichum asianum TaxID=702518 RepID=A0A8H3WFF8_9PEZI|nr:hypothetical protein GQ607_006847 [Colletotrichum asianum]
MSSVAPITLRDLLLGDDDDDHLGCYPRLETTVKLTNAKKPTVATFIKENVIVPPTAKPFPAEFWDFTDIVDDEDLDESAVPWLMFAARLRDHDGEASVETSLKSHYLNAASEIAKRKLPHLSERIQEIKLRFNEQQTVNVVVEKKDQAFKPDGQLDLEGFKPDGSKQAVVIFEAKAEKIVARAIANIREMLTDEPEEDWDERSTLPLQQIGTYCIVLNSRYGILYDDDCLIFVRFDDLIYTDGKPNFKTGLGGTCSIEVVEERSR